MGSPLLLLQVLVVTVVATAPTAQAWGKEGHYAVCKIAESFLTREASTVVKGLLPGWAAGELAETCSWADTERFKYQWSSPLHFADAAGDWDCHNTKEEKGMCVVGAINNYTAALKDSSSPFDPSESLMFLAHFVGDVHQPLHCGHTGDQGGNAIVVHWYTRKSNLHHVWDVNVIETAMRDFHSNDLGTMIEAIKLNITEGWSNEEKEWETCSSRTKTCADKYAQESAELARKAYEGIEQDSTLGDEYFFSALPVVEKRIAQGGVRLAAILNRIFSGRSTLQSS